MRRLQVKANKKYIDRTGRVVLLNKATEDHSCDLFPFETTYVEGIHFAFIRDKHKKAHFYSTTGRYIGYNKNESKSEYVNKAENNLYNLVCEYSFWAALITKVKYYLNEKWKK